MKSMKSTILDRRLYKIKIAIVLDEEEKRVVVIEAYDNNVSNKNIKEHLQEFFTKTMYRIHIYKNIFINDKELINRILFSRFIKKYKED